MLRGDATDRPGSEGRSKPPHRSARSGASPAWIKLALCQLATLMMVASPRSSLDVRWRLSS